MLIDEILMINRKIRRNFSKVIEKIKLYMYFFFDI